MAKTVDGTYFVLAYETVEKAIAAVEALKWLEVVGENDERGFVNPQEVFLIREYDEENA